jgi:hypothetical protein
MNKYFMKTKIKYIRVSTSFSLIIFLFLSTACMNRNNVTVPTYTEPVVTEYASDTLVDEEAVNTLEEDNAPNFHSHSIWDTLLKTHVNNTGFVNYKGFLKDTVLLNTYLRQLSANHPTDLWTKNETKAYWINAYNAFTVKLIVDNYPVKTIKELGGSIYKVNTPWDIKFINSGSNTYDLNNIEHGILRDEFPDARIHAVVNCASVSCPPLRNEAYTPEKLEVQMTEQMRYFINDKTKNTITESKVEVSSLFKWYSGDFTKEAKTVRNYINQFSSLKIEEGTKITYKSYDWNLNEQ